MSYADRIRLALEKSGRTRSALATALGVSSQAITYVLQGKTKSLSATNNALAAGFLGVDPHWLATGENLPASQHFSRLDRPEEKLLRVPIRGSIRTTIELRSLIAELPQSAPQRSVEFMTADRSAYALRAKGDGLAPRYRAEELIIVTPGVPPTPGRDVLVQTVDGTVLVMLLNWIRGEQLQMVGVPVGLDLMTFDRDEIKSMVRIAGSVIDDGTHGL